MEIHGNMSFFDFDFFSLLFTAFNFRAIFPVLSCQIKCYDGKKIKAKKIIDKSKQWREKNENAL